MNTKKSILIMDDDLCTSAFLSDLIRFYGFEVECVESCLAAKRRLVEKTFEGLVLDMWMADGTGRELLTWLRENGRVEPVVMMSANADYDQWIDLVNRGASDLLAKPVEPLQLKRALQMAMGEKYFTGRGWQPMMGL